MNAMLSTFLAGLRHDPRLVRWAVIFSFAHLLVFSVIAVSGQAHDLVVSQDAQEYLELAANPLTHGLYSLDGVTLSGKREPGYSGFMMTFMAAGFVTPHVTTVGNLWPIIVVQILLYGFVCLRISRAAAAIYGNLSGWASLLLMQATPIAIYQHMIRNECLTTILLGLLWVQIACRWKNGPSLADVGIAALWLGLLGLTKSINVLFVPVLSLLLWIRLPVRLPKVALFFVLSLLPAVAWTARNNAVFGMPIMGSIDGVSSLYRGNILPYQQISSPDHPDMPLEAQVALKLCKSDGEKYRWYKQTAITWLKDHPVQYVKQCAYRTVAMFVNLYRKPDFQVWQYPFRLLVGNQLLFLTLLLLACTLRLWRQHSIWTEASVVFFLFSVVLYGAVYGEERYLQPALFILAPVHAWCIVEVLVPRLRAALNERQRRSATSPLATP